MYTQLDLSKVIGLRKSVLDISKLTEFFGFGTDPIVGLDIGSTAIKVLQLSRSGERIRVDHYAFEPLTPGLVVEKTINDKDKVVAAIKAALAKAGITSQKMCVAIPSSIAVTKVLKMSANLNDKEIGTEIELESSKIIPYPLSDVNLDYTVLGPVENIESMVNVLVVATKSDNVNNVSSIVIDAGLTPAVIDLDSYAIARAFELVAKKLPAEGKNKVIAIFDIGATMMTLNVVDSGNLVFMREQAFGSQQLIDEIQNVYGITYEEAITGMRYDNLPKDYHQEVLDPFKQTVAQQISRACQFFISAGEYGIIDYIFLTGGCASVFGLDKLIQDKLQVKTFVANPFDDMVLSGNINKDEFKAATLRLMKCCGLALRNVM